MKGYFIYILFSEKDKKLYVGYTNNIKKRFSEHLRGEVIATAYRLPLKLIHYEYFTNKKDALAREKFLKSGYGHDQINAFLKNTLKNI